MKALLHLSFLIALAERGVSPLRIANWYEALFTAVRGASRREGIAIRSKARLLRMEKLKMASQVGENPGFDFLQQCWNDDLAKADCDQEVVGEVSAVGDCDCGWGADEVGGVMQWRTRPPSYNRTSTTDIFRHSLSL